MILDNMNIILGAVCLFGAFTCVFAEWRELRVVRILSKMAASTAFVAIAVVNGAGNTSYGRSILAALVLSWIGDALLLSLRSSLLLGGIAAFLLAHVAFGAAFVSLPLDAMWLMIALAILLAVSALLLRWLWPHLESFYKFAVPAYLAAIMMMTSLAVAASAAHGSVLLAVGAVIFAASDVSVARDRFVERSIVNTAWGLPLYFAAQIILAISVLMHG